MKHISPSNFLKSVVLAALFLGQTSASFANPSNGNPTTNQASPTLEQSLSAGINATVNSALGVTSTTNTTSAGKSNKCPPGQAKKGNCFCPPSQAKKGKC